MNYIVLLLIVWSIFQVVLSFWGLAIIDNECQNQTVFTKVRTLMVSSVVLSVILIAYLLCKHFCYDDDEDISFSMTTVVFAGSILVLAMQIIIGDNIGDCTSDSNAQNYKSAMYYFGVPTTCFVIVYCLYRYYNWMMNITARKRQLLSAKSKAKKEYEQKAKAEKAKRESQSRLDLITKARESVRSKKESELDKQIKEKTAELQGYLDDKTVDHKYDIEKVSDELEQLESIKSGSSSESGSTSGGFFAPPGISRQNTLSSWGPVRSSSFKRNVFP